MDAIQTVDDALSAANYPRALAAYCTDHARSLEAKATEPAWGERGTGAAARRTWLATLAILAATSCGGPWVRAAPINAYRAYGEYHPVSQDEAMVASAATANPDARPVRIFQEALPPGIEMNGTTLGVAKGYTHRLIGKYAYSSGQEQSKDALVAMVKKMCMVTDANAAIVGFGLVPNAHQDRAQSVEAILVDLHDEPSADEAVESPR